jgi:trk system potassium uptake protein TrkA
MNIVIVGAGKSGVYLAEKLRAHHSLTLIEPRPDRAEYVAARMPDVRVVRGDGCEPSVLDRANVGHADLVAALTGDDEDNLVVSLLAKQEFAVPRVVARVNHPKNQWLFTETWGVDVSVSTPQLLTALVEEAVSVGSLVRLLRFEGGNAHLVEVTLADDSPADGVSVADLGVPRDATIVAVVRADHLIVPRGDTRLAVGDEVLVLITADAEDEVQRLLVGP